MAIAGAGAGINELTALAATSELAPTAKRGKYVAVLIFTILPFCPSVLWGQLIASHSNWRYVGLFCGLWCFVGLVMTAIFYHPPPRVNSAGLSRREVISQIDFVGGFLSIVGIILFVAGLLWGGYQVSARFSLFLTSKEKTPLHISPFEVMFHAHQNLNRSLYNLEIYIERVGDGSRCLGPLIMLYHVMNIL
jgi:hypothetical protein